MWWLKDVERKSLSEITKEGLRIRVRTSGRANNTPGQLNLHRQAQREEKICKKRSQRAGVSLSCALTFPHSLLFCILGWHALTPRVDFPNTIELNTDSRSKLRITWSVQNLSCDTPERTSVSPNLWWDRAEEHMITWQEHASLLTRSTHENVKQILKWKHQIIGIIIVDIIMELTKGIHIL